MKRSLSRPKRPTYDRTVYVLVLRLLNPLRIESLHGSRVSDIVYHDLTHRFDAIARDILRRHGIIAPPWSPELGLWLVPFSMRQGQLGPDPAEQAQAISDAAVRSVREMLDTELGSAASMYLDFRVGVLKDTSGQTDPPRLFEKLSERIARMHETSAEPTVTRKTFTEMLAGPCLDFHLQPIVSLKNLKTVGFEALARGPLGGPLESPDRLFWAASYYGLRRELDRACVATALKRASRLKAPYWLSVNLGPDVFDAGFLRGLVPEAHVLRRRVFEITEHLPIASPKDFAAQAKPLRKRGARVALDDAGCGYLNFGMVEDLSPHIVKMCITIIRRIGGGPGIVAATREAVRRIAEAKALPLAEGVETEEQLRLVRECGFSLAQGWLFGRPKPIPEILAKL